MAHFSSVEKVVVILRILVLIGVLLAVVAGVCLPVMTLAAEAEIAPLAVDSLLLDGQVAGERIVVVGERGHVLVSDDAGHNWAQRPVPTRATLTSVFFVNDRLGWAAGHDAVILRTTDGGESWQLVYEDQAGERPILDIWFRDENFGCAVGAYGLFLTTTDGGTTWQDQLFEAEDLTPAASVDAGNDDWYEGEEDWGKDVHLNQIRQAATGRLYIAGEAGNVYRSDDGGATWLSLAPPYEGSLFGSLALPGESLLVYGLRGNLLFSPDAGLHWAAEASGVVATLNDAIRLRDGRIVLAGLAGTLLVSRDNGRTLTAYPQADRAGLSRVLEIGDGALLLIGTHGVRRFQLPAPLALPPVQREDDA